MSRRCIAVAAVAVTLCLAGCGAPPLEQNVIVVHVGSGNWADANIAAYVEPFEKETGIRVIRFADDVKTSQLKLMHDADNMQVDVISMTAMHSARAAKLNLLAPVDYSLYRKEELAGMADEVRKPWGVGALYYCMVLGWNSRHLDGQPRGWRDFWDVRRFPGNRTLMTGEFGDGPWEEALVADGVPPERIYPIDVNRVFRSLERIRPQVIKWWRVGSEGQQVFRDGIVELGGVYDGRIAGVSAENRNVHFTYDQGKRLLDYWVVPAKAPHLRNAQRFVEFATRARQQALFAQRISYGPTNLGAFKYIPEPVARRLPSYPANMARQIRMDVDWYLQTDERGVANIDRMIQRWYAWMLR